MVMGEDELENRIAGVRKSSSLSFHGDGSSDINPVNSEELRRDSVELEGALDPQENAAEVVDQLQQQLDQDELKAMSMALKNTPNGVEIYSINPLNPGVNGPLQLSVNVNQTTNAVTISMATVDPILLKKIDKFTDNRKFTVKSCESIETAKALLKKYGDKLVFDDTNPMIAGFKARLEAEAQAERPGVKIKFTSDAPEDAPHHPAPGLGGHHGG